MPLSRWMQRLLPWKKVILGVPVALTAAILVAIGGLYAWGSSLPVEHTTTRAAALDAPPEAVWAAVSGYAEFPSWRAAVLDVRSEAFGWVEITPMGELPVKVTTMEPPSLLVTRIDAADDLGFAGTWTYALAPEGDGTRLTLTEAGEVHKPLFRAFMHLFGPEATVEDYLGELEAHLSRPASSAPARPPSSPAPETP